MFSRIFHLPKKEEKKELPCEWHENLDDFQAAPRLPKFGKANIRVLIFRECDKKGKSLLFDSDAVVEIDNDEASSTEKARNLNSTPNSYSSSSPSHERNPKYKCLKPKSDTKMLGEMMFGSVTMTHRGSIVRVHYIRTPPQLLMSKVFATRSRSSGNGLSEGNSSTSFSQSDSFSCQPRSFSSGNISIPLMCSSPNRSLPGSVCNPTYSTPSSLMYAQSANYSMTSIDSLNISAGHLPQCSPVPSPGSSLNRRLQRSQMTRLENYQHSKLKAHSSEELPAVYRGQPKIGIGVVFKLWESHEERNKAFQNFMFSHYTLYERHLQKLRITIERGLFSKKNFIVSAVEAVDNFKEDILNFYSAPRLLEPVWLNMMNIRDKQEEIAERFINILTKSVVNFETKENNYFLSSLLTAVLMHHLAWVPTVTPSGSAHMRAYLDKHSSRTLDVLARCHPYNPLWAQLGDLYGTLGYPPQVTKTIVVGKDPSLVRQILYILSYFIRCSDIKEYSISIDFDSDYDCFSTKNSDRLSCYSKTPTNTPIIESWAGNFPRNTPVDKSTDQGCLMKNGNAITLNDEDVVFDDAEEICSCMCSVLQSIDYIGGRSLRNLRKTSVKKDTENRHVEFEKDLNTKNKKTKNIGRSKSSKQGITSDKMIIHSDTNKSNFVTQIPKHPSFRCYCCPDKQYPWRTCSETSLYTEKSSLRTIYPDTTDSSMHSDIDSKSCFCLHQETSEYGSETVSNCQSTLSRQSSCASCLEFFRRAEMRSLDVDSDYSSITNEEFTSQIDHNGIELDLHEIDEDMNTINIRSEEIDLDDDVKSMNLQEIHLPDSEIKAVPQRQFDHKVDLPNFGRSLLAGYCDNFVSDFALHGVKSVDFDKIEKDLKLSLKHSAVDEAVSNAAYIIADVDTRKCKLVTLSRNTDSMLLLPSDEIVKSDIYGSSLVSELLDSLKGLWDLNIPFQFCLMHLEDKLQDIFSRSEILAEYIKLQRRGVSRREIEEKFGFRGSDLDLLMATASTHSPFVPQMVE